jgi:hypothetical protein
MERSPTHDIHGLDGGWLLGLIPVPICPDHHVAANLGTLRPCVFLLKTMGNSRPVRRF